MSFWHEKRGEIKKPIIEMTVSELADEIEKQSDDFLNANILGLLETSRAIDVINDLPANKAQAVLYMLCDILDVETITRILSHNATDKTLTGNATYSGINRFGALNLNGYTYTADGQPHVIIAEELKIPSASKIVKTPTGGAGGAGADGAGDGGRGGGAIYIIANTLYLSGSIEAKGENGEDATSFSSEGTGSGGAGGVLPKLDDFTGGAGGRGGGESGSTVCAGGGGGAPNGARGGGSNPGGSGGSVSYQATTPIDLARDVLKASVDWWLVNVMSKTPSTTKSFPNFYNAGGGGGGAVGYDYYATGGGGGGGGGIIVIISGKVRLYGTISAKGGRGGNHQASPGVSRPDVGGGGGGGGGGIILLTYKKGIVDASIDVSGGSAGSSGSVDYPATNGNNGKAFILKV